MSDQLPSLDAINHLLFDDFPVIHPELRDLMHLYVSGRLVDCEAIDYEAAAHAIRDRRGKLNRHGGFLYDEEVLFRAAFAAAIGDGE